MFFQNQVKPNKEKKMSGVMHDIYLQIMSGPHQEAMKKYDRNMRWAIVYFALYDPETRSPCKFEDDCNELIKSEAVDGATMEEKRKNALVMMRNISIEATLQDETTVAYLRKEVAKYQNSKKRRKGPGPNDKDEIPPETSPPRPM